jgi:hypothetical protein
MNSWDVAATVIIGACAIVGAVFALNRRRESHRPSQALLFSFFIGMPTGLVGGFFLTVVISALLTIFFGIRPW